jgi:predicted DNA-binding transcriptional regulator AlpA
LAKALNILPPTLAPRGLSRAVAAAYLGISQSLFDQMVEDGRMPGPKTINSRVIWDRIRLDQFFEALPDKEVANVCRISAKLLPPPSQPASPPPVLTVVSAKRRGSKYG